MLGRRAAPGVHGGADDLDGAEVARERLEERAVAVGEAQRLQLGGRVGQRGGEQRAQHVQPVQHVALQRKRRAGEKRPQRGARGREAGGVSAVEASGETHSLHDCVTFAVNWQSRQKKVWFAHCAAWAAICAPIPAGLER